MGRLRLLSVVKFTFALCCVSTAFVLSTEVEVECVTWNFEKILCRWKNIRDGTETIRSNITVEFAAKGSPIFQECVESPQPLHPNHSSCVLSYPSAWLNKTLLRKLSSSNELLSNPTVDDFIPALVLSPPVIKFSKKKIDGKFNVSLNVSFDEPFIGNMVSLYCGTPELSIFYQAVGSQELEEYSDELSWKEWKSYKTWDLHKYLKYKDRKMKNVKAATSEIYLDTFPANKEYLLQVRWRADTSFCKSDWSPFRTYEINTHNIILSPINIQMNRDSNVTLTCKSSYYMDKFEWRILPGDGNSVSNPSLPFTIPSEDGFTSHYDLVHMKETDYNVECLSTVSKEDYAGILVHVGETPKFYGVDCLMHNMERIYCRYSVFRLGTSKHFTCPSKFDFKWRFVGKDLSGRDKQDASSCHASSEIDVAAVIDSIMYAGKVEISVSTSNVFGVSTANLTFNPLHKIHPSAPLLSIASTVPDRRGAVVTMEATFPDIRSQSLTKLLRYCDNSSLKYRFKKLVNDTDVSRLKLPTTADFLDSWIRGRNTSHYWEEPLVAGVDYVTHSGTLPKEHMGGKEPDPVQFPIRSLAANTRYLVEVIWKTKSFMCNGSWSIPSYHEIVIENLAPPAFRDSSLIFLADDSPVPGNFFDANVMEGASLLVWNNIDMSNPEIQERNNVQYSLASSDGSFVRNATWDFGDNNLLVLPNRGSSGTVKAIGSNEVETVSTVAFRKAKIGPRDCVATVVSISSQPSFDSSLTFKVEWVYAKSSYPHDCEVSTLEDNIKVHFFTWSESCETCVDRSNRNANLDNHAIPTNATAYSFVLSIQKSRYNESELVFGTRVVDLSDMTNISYPFGLDTGYGIGVALSTVDEPHNIRNQSSTLIDPNLYYEMLNPDVSTGAPMQLTASDVGTTQLTISWRPSRPQRRHMPVLRYEIFMTHDKQCALGHDDEICDWQEHVPGSCFATPAKLYEVTNSSEFGSWEYEKRNYSNVMSVTFFELSPGTSYYITVWEVTKAGRSKCLRHINEITAFNFWVAYVVLGFLVTFAAVLLLLKFRRKVKKVFQIDIPEPRIWIDWKSVENESEPTTDNQDSRSEDGDDRSNCYVALLRSVDNGSTTPNSRSNSETMDVEHPIMITDPDLRHNGKSDARNHGNNNEILKRPHGEEDFEDAESADAYCVASSDSAHGRTLTETTSLGSDEPCCSVSTGNISGMSAGDEEAGDTYISANEAANMSWLLGFDSGHERVADRLLSTGP